MRVGLLGVGRLGAAHAATLRTLKEVTELRVYDADAGRARDIAKDVGAVAVDTVDAVLDGVDAAVIVTPTDTHAPIIRRCLDAGIATFCEKPIAIGIPETKEIVAHAERTKGRLQIGFQRRFDAGYRAAREALAGGKLGPVYSFLMVSCDRLPPPDGYIATSGGQFKDQFIHDFDITRFLFADEVDEVTATGSTQGFPQYEAMNDVGTSAVMLKLRGGALGLATALRHNEAGYDIHVEIHAAKDTLAIGIDPRTPWRSVEADAPKLAGPAYPSFFVRFGDAYKAELAYFLKFARGEAENLCTAGDALEALRIAEAAGRSWRERRTVKLSEIV
ncbi:MAG TPA: Gfo/Idh/MocA family oxidoreductase [Candidatus Limnocylindrales bacterium]|nr:Gfo/Idh/MocA family oxidoreductase [Candidatus Limnocylindrales bacterium]